MNPLTTHAPGDSSDPTADKTRCLGCGYWLDGLCQPRCPECGRSFDPLDPTTFLTGTERLKWRRWAQPPPLWNLALAAVATLAILDDASKPLPPNFMMYLLGPFFVIGLAVDYIVRLGALRSDRRRAAGDRQPHTHRKFWRWFVLPMGWLIALAAIVSDWDLHKRFELSQPAFDRVVANIQPGQEADTGFRVIGLYYVWEVRRTGPSRIEFVTGQGLIHDVGFLYDQAPSKPRRAQNRLSSQWYTAKW